MPPSNAKEVGANYEQAAMNFLQTRGLIHIDSNFTCRSGEIDLIMKDHSTIVFVEVKYRKNQCHGHAAEAVTYRKAQKLIKTANVWMLKHRLSPYNTDFRFDVVAIHRKGQDIEWYQNAITQE